MKKVKIKPIVLTQALSAKAVSTNLTIVLDAQVEMANQINESIAEFNSAINSLPKQVDEEEIIKTFNLMKANFKEIKESIKEQFDPTDLNKEIESLKSNQEKGSSEEIKELKESLKLLSEKFDQKEKDQKEKDEVSNKNLSIVQSELRSARKTLGASIDQLRIANERLTEVK